MKTELTAARLRELLHYDPETGAFTWKADVWCRNRVSRHAGQVAGTVNICIGYRLIGIDGTQFYAHRLAILYITGAWPAAGTDHKNGQRDDNRFSNLRPATQGENMQNTGVSPMNTSGYPGVTWHRQRGKWAACIKVNRKKKHLGLFSCAKEAGKAYEAAKASMHTFAPRVRLIGES